MEQRPQVVAAWIKVYIVRSSRCEQQVYPHGDVYSKFTVQTQYLGAQVFVAVAGNRQQHHICRYIHLGMEYMTR